MFGYANSKKCNNCNCPEEDIQHLLLDCPEVEKFRQTVYSKIHKNFNKADELLGYRDRAYSFILLNINRFIYQRKFLNQSLNPHEFYAMLKTEKAIEENIAVKNKTFSKHVSKWNNILKTDILD